jgi:signal transduction histidine kinase
VITRLLRQRMGATMAIDSEVGRGTRVRVSLPLARVARQEAVLEGR